MIQCGGLPTPPCAVRFNPILFQLRSSSDVKPIGPFSTFKYRMVFAVACVHSVLFYDTESLTRPFATVEGLHCAEHTDLSWSADGRTCLVSSVDGYISTICFSPDELGPVLPRDQIPSWLQCAEPTDVANNNTSGSTQPQQPVAKQNTGTEIKTIVVNPVSARTTVVTPVPIKEVVPTPKITVPEPTSGEAKTDTTLASSPIVAQPVEVIPKKFTAQPPVQPLPEAPIPTQAVSQHDVQPSTIGKKRSFDDCVGTSSSTPCTPKNDAHITNDDVPPDTTKTTTPQGYRITPPGPDEKTEYSTAIKPASPQNDKPITQQPAKKLKLASTPKRKAKSQLVQTKFFFPKPKDHKTTPNVALEVPVSDEVVKQTEPSPKSNTTVADQASTPTLVTTATPNLTVPPPTAQNMIVSESGVTSCTTATPASN